jgi:hypothetical protein
MKFAAYENRLAKTWITRLVLVIAMFFVVNAPVKPIDAQQPTAAPTQAAAPQSEDGWVAIKLDEGIVFVWNAPGLYFTLTIKGKEIKPLNDLEHIFFSVDGLVFQLQLASVSEFAPDAKERKLDDKTILAAHRDWEWKYLEGLLGSKLKVQSIDTKLDNGSQALQWQIDMPAGRNADAKKQLYLTIVGGNYVLLVNSVATNTISDDVARKFLLETIATLRVSPTPIDVKKLSDSIRKGIVY